MLAFRYLLLALTRARLSREDAYRLVQANALRSQGENGSFEALVRNDPEVKAVLSEREIEQCLTLEGALRNVDRIFDRVLSRRT